MIKKFLLFGIAFILLSCDRNTEIGNNPEEIIPVLATKIINNDAEGTFGVNFKYDGDKLLEEIYSSGDKKSYTYDGNNIIKTVITSSNGIIYETQTFTYKNDKLSTKEILKNYDNVKSTYTYTWLNNNESKCEIVAVWPDCTYYESIDYFYNSGNLIKTISRSSVGGTITTNYEYDDKNNFYKNILGLSKALIDDPISSQNNVLKINSSQSIYYDGSTHLSNFSDVYSYEYNSNNYPLKRITNNNSNLYTTYTYNK